MIPVHLQSVPALGHLKAFSHLAGHFDCNSFPSLTQRQFTVIINTLTNIKQLPGGTVVYKAQTE